MKHIVRVISHWGLLLHIYISMAGFTLVLLFAVTGLTLNHQDFGWSEPRLTTSTVTLPLAMLSHPDRAEFGNELRERLKLHSEVSDYREDDTQIQVTFAVPGHRTLVTINRADGKTEIEQEERGLLGKLDDLHKGFDSGPVWYWIIDISAILLTVSSLTGMVTLLSLRARRRSGFIVASLGVAMVIAIYLAAVPR
jgi:hypothetical protein